MNDDKSKGMGDWSRMLEDVRYDRDRDKMMAEFAAKMKAMRQARAKLRRQKEEPAGPPSPFPSNRPKLRP